METPLTEVAFGMLAMHLWSSKVADTSLSTSNKDSIVESLKPQLR